MFNLKKFAFAAAIVLVATGAMASNFRAADQVYLPIAGHLAGGSGLFLSDVYVANTEVDSVTVSMIFSTGSGGTQNKNLSTFTLLPGERKEFIDFFTALNITGLGQVIFNACKSGGNCDSNTCQGGDPNAGTCPDFRKITVQSRIYSVPNPAATVASQPTTGQDMPGMPLYSYASMDQAANGLDKVFIDGIRLTGTGGTGTYRTNIGLVNASQYSTTQLKVTVMNSSGQVIGTGFQTLSPLGQAQPSLASLASITPAASLSGLWATVEQISSTPTGDSPAGCGANGCPGFFAYASVLDNASGDATTLEPQFFKSLDYALSAIYPGSSAGKTSIRRAVKH